jgi:hypothetical protein
MRVYFPATVEHLVALRDRQPLQLSQGYAAIPQWVSAQDETDAEVLEDYLLYVAAEASLELGENRTQAHSRIVVVAELADSLVETLDAHEARVGCGTGEIGLAPKSIQAVFVDDQRARDLIAQGESAEDESLSWFGPTEGQNILEFLGR